MEGEEMDNTYRLNRLIDEHNRRVKMSGGMEDMSRMHRDALNDLVTYDPMSKTGENKYARTIKGASVDVYDILQAYRVTNPAVQHAIKKLLQPGDRGHKDKLTDLREAGASINRAIELEMGK